MTKLRISISYLMTVIVLIGLAFAALRTPNPLCAGVVTTLTVDGLLLVAIAAIVKKGNERLPWLGFALFGSGYYALHFISESAGYPILNMIILMRLSGLVPPVISSPTATPGGIPRVTIDEDPLWTAQQASFDQISVSILALINGLVGSILARYFATNPDDPKATDRP